MRVMVTGASTPLAAALIEHLCHLPDVDLVLAVGDAWPTAHHHLHFHYVDLTKPRAVHDLIWGEARELGIDAIVHGIQHRCARDRGLRVHRQNVDSTRELILACADHPTIRRLVYRSFAEVYSLRHTTSDLLDEDAPLDFDPVAPQWLRDRVEADVTACAHLGGRLSIAILRCAEFFAPHSGSQLWDYLSSRVCLRPLGFDPMLNLLSIDDGVAAFTAALHRGTTGVFNIAGYDTLPLSRAIARTGRIDVPMPGPLMDPLYRLRRAIAGFDFRYDMNVRRFHFGGVVDGTRARTQLGYAPSHPVQWRTSERLFARSRPAGRSLDSHP